MMSPTKSILFNRGHKTNKWPVKWKARGRKKEERKKKKKEF